MNDIIMESIAATHADTNKLNLIHEAIQTTNDTMMARNRSNKYNSGCPRPNNNFNEFDKPRRRLDIDIKNNNMNDGQAKENDCDSSCAASKYGNRNNDVNENSNGHSNKKFKNNINCKRGSGYPSDNEDDTGCNNLGDNWNENNDDDDIDEEIDDNRDNILIKNRSLIKGNKNNTPYTPVLRRNTEELEDDNRDLTDVSPATSEDATNSTRSSYMNDLVDNGHCVNNEDLHKQVEIIIKDRVWGLYKLPDVVDYAYNSPFCNKILFHLNIEVKTMNRRGQEMWSRIMPMVKSEYQITRSTVTQSMKQNFNGT